MELPLDGGELRAAAGHSSHGSAPQELIVLPPYNIASQMQITSGNLALETWTNSDYGDANQLNFSGTESLDFFAHTMPDNTPSTWFPLTEPIHPLDYFDQQHFGGAICNAGPTVAFPDVVHTDRCTPLQSDYTIPDTSESPVQLQYFATNSNGEHRKKKRKRTVAKDTVDKNIPCATCWGMGKGVCSISHLIYRD
jgi:hypothetical protein